MIPLPAWAAGAAFKLGVVGVLVVGAFIGGCVARGKYDAGELLQARGEVSMWKNTAENRGSAIAEINAQANANALAAKARVEEAEAAANGMAAAAAAAGARADAFDAELERQKRRKPDCATLLAMNLFAACGVKPR